MSKPDFRSFENQDEWILIVAHLRRMEIDFVNDVIEAGKKGDAETIMNISGRLAMIREFIALPEFLFALERTKPDAKKPD